mmetsp:Transcript_19601/g.37955  ORF Transcript_19601/g.37955 Transcript_19601/m.37955 type:complete len:93 (-) Transcript_19601:57-335(-)
MLQTVYPKPLRHHSPITLARNTRNTRRFLLLLQGWWCLPVLRRSRTKGFLSDHRIAARSAFRLINSLHAALLKRVHSFVREKSFVLKFFEKT